MMLLTMKPRPDDEFLPEIWGLYSVGVLWLLLRFVVRIRTMGMQGLQLDDGFSFIVLMCWTLICVGIHITYYTGTGVDFSSDEVAQFDENQMYTAAYGSKLYLATWYA